MATLTCSWLDLSLILNICKQAQTLNQALSVDCGSPAFKKPNKIPKEEAHRRRNHPQVQSSPHKRALPENGKLAWRLLTLCCRLHIISVDKIVSLSLHRANSVLSAERKHRVENMWSIDPALALSMYDSEQGADEVLNRHVSPEWPNSFWVVVLAKARLHSVSNLGWKRQKVILVRRRI